MEEKSGKGIFLELAKGLKLSTFTLPPATFFYLFAWTGVSSLSTKFLTLQDFFFFYMHIGMQNYKVYSTQYTTKVKIETNSPQASEFYF